MSYQACKILIIYFNSIKNLILICVKENRLVDAENSKNIYFSKDLIFQPKKLRSNLQRNINV